MKKEKENLRESKLTCNINLYKIKSAEMFAEFISNEEEEFYMICPKCGSEMPDDSAFCTRCGASLHTGTQENQNSQGGPQQGNPQGTPYGYGNPQGKIQRIIPQNLTERILQITNCLQCFHIFWEFWEPSWHFLWRRILLMSDFMCVRESGSLCLKFCWD